MPAFSYNNIVYFNEIYNKPKSYHKHLIQNIYPDITLIAPSYLLKISNEISKDLCWKYGYSMDVTKFSNCCKIVNNWCVEHKNSGKGRNVVCKRQLKDILDYCEYSRLCNVIYKISE